MIELDRTTEEHYGAKLRIIGVGGGGGNAVNSMIDRGLAGCEFMVVNTDVQALQNSLSPIRVQVGRQLTRGLGAGATPTVGRDAVLENRDEIHQALHGADMVFVTCGMGGGTGTGGAPVVAEIAKAAGALVVGVVTRPFDWEGKRRKDQAELGIKELKQHVDTLIVVPNQKLLSIIDKRVGFRDAFRLVDDVLYNATRGIAEIITGHGVVNVDFADVRTVMKDMGEALMGTGIANGEYRATEAAQNAISSPLLEGISISGAEGVLINIAASSNMTMMEVDEAVKVVYDAVGSDANIIFGVVLNDDLADQMMVTVIATGFNKAKENKVQQPAEASWQNNGFRPQQVAQQQAAQPMVHQAQQPMQQPAQPSIRTAYPFPHEGSRVPIGQEELEQYNEPAVMRRGSVGIHRGGFDIRRQDAEANANPEQQEQQEQQHERRRQAVEKPAFLRRIMD
ncbi:MAG: cell division protein FtsZ [Candidatus Kapabacteria bacterium]|nr:cell division protein FtsZ [Candidatus Kapabacteria bacterium]